MRLIALKKNNAGKLVIDGYVLTRKQALFCEAYVSNGYHGINAVKAAGYKFKTLNAASALAAENLTKPSIKAYIDYLQKVSGCSDEDRIKKTVISIEERRELLTKFVNADDIKYADRLKALDLLNKMDAAYEQKVTMNTTINNPLQNLSTEDLRSLATNLIENKKS